MNEHFRAHVESLHPSYEALLCSAPFVITAIPKQLPTAGVYLLSEGQTDLYVGRTNRMRGRLQERGRPSSSHDSAPFAFRLARVKRDVLKATYKTEGSRKHLLQDEAFRNAFIESKARVRLMNIRVIEQADPLRQALLEMYVALSLSTPYNDFDNH